MKRRVRASWRLCRYSWGTEVDVGNIGINKSVSSKMLYYSQVKVARPRRGGNTHSQKEVTSRVARLEIREVEVTDGHNHFFCI